MANAGMIMTIVAAEANKPPAGGGGGTQSPLMLWMFPIFIVFMIFLWMQSRSQQKKQKKEREEMLSSLKPKDKVETIGGIFGTVVNVRENDVTLRVDDAKDISVKVARSAVRRKLDGKSESSGEQL